MGAIRHTSQMHMESGTVLQLTNRTGSTRSAGDVVRLDEANDESFTTSAASNTIKGIGVVRESIANGSNGPVVFGGYAPNVNVLGSAVRGDFLYTATTSHKAAHMAGIVPSSGAFGLVLANGSNSNPSALIFNV